eukprot:CAMPEP_0172610006 /NCGR_PEP_ID=MMETSP1068-20121228/29885_1 /TAXON_ID=35684 /ORGANISM="Pseudopedinella elastica, Strain CCMP716" /LENGTH=448 /DNA_ID=CAMNT_0013413631 /DNA_START=1 /DNA_END=1347 /DNA_ORIENTATION=-
MSNFTAQDLDNLASGFARHELRWRSRKLVTALSAAGAAMFKAGTFPPRNSANLLTAVAKLSSTAKGSCDGTREFVAAASADIMSTGRLESFNLKDLANAGWGLAILGQVKSACMVAIGRHAASKLEGFNAQECARLLYAMGKSGVDCKELTAAAGKPQDLKFSFPDPVRSVSLTQQMGGTGARWNVREGTGAIAGNGGALFEDSFVLAEWLARQRGGAAGVASAVGAPTSAAAAPRKCTWDGASAVELGAGIGLCSIVAARLGMRVVASDGDQSVLEQLAANVARNPPTSGDELRSALLRWGDPSPLEALGIEGAPDLVMATGCVYGRDSGVWSALARTLAELAGPNTLVVLVHGTGAAPGVHQLRGEFYGMLAPNFEVARLPQHELHADHALGCQIHVLWRKQQMSSVVLGSSSDTEQGATEKADKKRDRGAKENGPRAKKRTKKGK